MNITDSILSGMGNAIYAVNAFSDLITYGQNALFNILTIKTIIVGVMDKAVDVYSFLLHSAQLLPDHIPEKLP